MLVAVMAAEENRLSSMFVFFFIALLIVSPFGYKQISGVMRERRARLAPDDVDVGGGPAVTSSAEQSAAANDLARVVDAIASAGSELTHDREGHRVVDLPAEPTVEGRPAASVVVDALLDDAVRRSGLSAQSTVGPDGRRQLRLTLR